MKRKLDVFTLRNRLLRVMRECEATADNYEKNYFHGMVDALNWVLGDKENGVDDFIPTPPLFPIDK